MKHAEDSEQQTLFDWAEYYPVLRWMFAIPNGGKRSKMEAARLKRQGVKAGVSDIFLPLPTESTEELSDTGYNGLFIEMKRRKVDGPSRPTPKQKEFHVAMTRQGYKCVVCYGAEEAIQAIKEYVSL